MANEITVTAAHVAPVYRGMCEIFPGVMSVAVTKGQALYQTTAGTMALADASASPSTQVIGIALEAKNAGEVVSILKKGWLTGFTLGTYEDYVYLSDTAGALSTVVGTVHVTVGKVMCLADRDLTEVLYFEAQPNRSWGSGEE